MVNYHDYLQSDKWRKKCNDALLKADSMCEHPGCYEKEKLSVHHLTYIRLGDELPEDLIVLCDYHHKAYEARKGNPPHDGTVLDFYQWVILNFGDDWQDTLPIDQAKSIYLDYLKSEYPLDDEAY